MYYHFAILLLFRPLIKLRIIGSQVCPRDVCLEAANAIQDLLTSYSRLYTLKWAPSFMPYFALTSSIMHLTIMAATVHRGELDTTERTDSHVSETFKQGIANLAEMTPYHHIAEQAPHILSYLAKKWNVGVDVDTGAALNLEEYEKVIRPFAGSLNSFPFTMIVEDSICHWNMGQEVEMAESMESPLFWPFLMQRRPMLMTGKELEQTGFAVL
uniref:Genomic scaffold, CS5907_Ctg0297 n=1 Tax=Fusarium acuminatum CS5907 TaxID=1318461 RepID=A0A096PEN5_9HYPO|nr:unnamed protein product [Fusarium acuminatum CS5907]